MTLEELPPQAARVLQALSSSTTCTTSTVDCLRCLLVARHINRLQSQRPESVRHPGRSTQDTRAPKPKGRRPRKEPVVTVLEEEQKEPHGLLPRQNERLATQVVNVVLTSLTAALKDIALRRRTKPTAATDSDTSKLSSKSKKGSSRQEPLAPRCVNRLSASPDQSEFIHHTSPSLQTLGLKAQSECACIAFAALRRIQAEKEVKTSTVGLQLENGLSAFIGKIIALGFHDLATRELILLKAMIDGAKPLLKDDYPAVAPKLTKKTLSELLKCSEKAATGLHLPLMISLHFHVLKTLAASPNSELLETALQYVAPWSTRSTVELVQRQMELDLPGSREKVAHQFDSLSHLLFGLCSKENERANDEAFPSTTSSEALITFRLQSSAFQIRATWWEIASHRGDVVTEILKPLSRCLGSFARTTRASATESYQIVKIAVEKLMDQVRQCDDRPVISYTIREQAMVKVYEQMADLARENYITKDVDVWRKEASELMTRNDASKARKLSINFRRAVGDLRASTETGDDGVLTQQLTLIIQQLGCGFAGDIEDCEDLLASTNSMRKSIVPLINECCSLDRASSSQVSATVKELSESILLRGTPCVRHCIDIINTQAEKDKRYDRVAGVAMDVASRYIESLVALSKGYLTGTDRWEHFSICLQESLSIINGLEGISCTLPSVDVALRKRTSLSVAISNVYWSRFAFLKENRAEKKALKEVLELSIRPIDSRLLQLQFTSLLPPRLEQEGLLHAVSKDYRKAAESYLRALRLLTTSNALKALAEASASQSPSQVFSGRGRWSLLGRLLTAYPKAVFRIKGQRDIEYLSIFDDESLPTAERGLLLEEQIKVIHALQTSEGTSSQIRGAIRAIASTIMLIYTKQAFPIRRLRAANQLLRVGSADPSILRTECYEKLYDMTTISNYIPQSLDLGLITYKAHLEASHRVYITMINEAANITAVCSSLEAWSSMLQRIPDYDSLCRCVDDIPSYRFQLECLAQYLEGHNLGLERSKALKLSAAVCEMSKPLRPADIAIHLSMLGSQFTSLGLSNNAGTVLQRAKKYLDMTENSDFDIVVPQWHLAYAEYSLSIGNFGISEQYLGQAGIMLRQFPEGEDSRKSNDRSDQIALMSADAAKIHSALSFAQGKSLSALHFGRLAVKILHWVWAKVQSGKDTQDNSSYATMSETRKGGVQNSISSSVVSAPTAGTLTRARQQLPTRRRAWYLIPRLFEGLLKLSKLYAHEGLFPEAQYYTEQAQKVAGNVRSALFDGRFHAQAGYYTARGGDGESDLAHFDQARSAYQAYEHDFGHVDLQMFLAEKYTRQEDFESAESAYAIANDTLGSLTNSFSSLCRKSGLNESALDTLMANLTFESVPEPKNIPIPREGKGTKVPVPACYAMKEPHENTTTLSVSLHDRKIALLRQQAWTSLQAGNLNAAHELLASTAGQALQPHQMILQTLLEAHLSLRRALDGMANDLTFGVLQESTTSCPSLKQINPSRVRISEQAPEKTEKATRVKKSTSRAPAKDKAEIFQPHSSDFRGSLKQTQVSLSQIFALATKAASTTEAHDFVDVSARTLVMLSSLGSTVLGGNISPTGISVVIELGRTLASLKEKKTIEIERQLSFVREPQHWLEENCITNKDISDRFDLSSELSTFLSDLTDIIPASWTVVSLSLTESHNELRISRLQCQQSPLTMSIPFNRHSSRDPDEETFSFDQGRAEMRDIINLANYSTHNAADPSKKGAKTAWWEARAALDARLKDLLMNIESIWLGGFRAMFSTSNHDLNLLLRFQETLQNIFDRHLPSRQKQPKSGKLPRLMFDSQVIELFVRLGDPNGTDLDEQLTDLLYFVVDILQFHGESNAYDEIDFDAVMVEVLDALRSYHAAANDMLGSAESQHTVLVVDKALHSFPWESLPCMKGQAVSRVPSMSFLHDRILQQRAQNCRGERFTISRFSGSYVLNPSSDLTATQSRFEEQLATLTTWDPIVNREPTEEELKANLQNKDLFLYFGHGSGGQYIRPRAIKKLDRCAVALLMGCSSGTMKEAGLYESYGTPMNYMHAGSPAVLATLWDVTDKDIDRFSQEVLEKWGLLEQQTPEVKSNTARSRSPAKRGSPVKKSRQGAKQKKMATRETMSLDQAVATSRDTCIMKYLNGAAPVIYGIPVFLS